MSDTTQTSRDAILQTAQRLILKHGYDGLSMRELAEESGYAKGTIYHHFRDKREIFLSALERDLVTVRDRLRDAATGDGAPVERLRAVIECYFEMVAEKRHVILATLREIGGLEREMRLLVQKHRASFLEPLTALLKEGSARGDFRPMNADLVVITLIGMMNSFVTHRLLVVEMGIGAEIVDHTLTLLLHGISRNSAAG